MFPRFRDGQRITALQLKARERDALGAAAMPWVDREHQVEAPEPNVLPREEHWRMLQHP